MMEIPEFGTLEEMVQFWQENKDTYEIAFQSDLAHLYKRGEHPPLATIYDGRCGIIAMEEMMRMIPLFGIAVEAEKETT